MKIETNRFGTIEIDDESLITFKDGLPGFSKLRKFCLVEGSDDTNLFMWLQSGDDPRVAFPVIEPQICAPSYKTPVSEKDLALLAVKDPRKVKVLCIVTIPENPREMTANLRAPIVISLATNQATQVISSDSSYPVRYAIFNDLQRFVTVRPQSDDRNSSGAGVDSIAGKPSDANDQPQFQVHRLKESGA